MEFKVGYKIVILHPKVGGIHRYGKGPIIGVVMAKGDSPNLDKLIFHVLRDRKEVTWEWYVKDWKGIYKLDALSECERLLYEVDA